MNVAVLVTAAIILLVLSGLFAANKTIAAYEIFGNAWGIVCILFVFPFTAMNIVTKTIDKNELTALVWSVTALYIAYLIPMLVIYSKSKFGKLNGMYWGKWFIALAVIVVICIISSITVTSVAVIEEEEER